MRGRSSSSSVTCRLARRMIAVRSSFVFAALKSSKYCFTISSASGERPAVSELALGLDMIGRIDFCGLFLCILVQTRPALISWIGRLPTDYRALDVVPNHHASLPRCRIYIRLFTSAYPSEIFHQGVNLIHHVGHPEHMEPCDHSMCLGVHSGHVSGAPCQPVSGLRTFDQQRHSTSQPATKSPCRVSACCMCSGRGIS
jgi:hypothetical protein